MNKFDNFLLEQKYPNIIGTEPYEALKLAMQYEWGKFATLKGRGQKKRVHGLRRKDGMTSSMPATIEAIKRFINREEAMK